MPAGKPEIDPGVVRPYLDGHPHPLLFVTGSGAHLYGFASRDSDYDLRGAHVLPARDLLGLDRPSETHEVMDKDAPIEMDFVTHDVRKFFLMLLKKNGYVLEQIFSPIVLHAGDGFDQLRNIAARCLTRHHHYHFDSFAKNQWRSVAGPSAGTVKGLLYTYRPLLAGIHLMTEHQVESNIVVLNERFRLTYIDELIEAKRAGSEKGALESFDQTFHEAEFERLRDELHRVSAGSGLPDTVPAGVRRALNDLLLSLRRAAAA